MKWGISQYGVVIASMLLNQVNLIVKIAHLIAKGSVLHARNFIPNLKAFALNEKRCNSCQKKYEHNKKKKGMKKLEDDIENDEIKEPEGAAKDMGMENSEDDGGEEEEEEDDDGKMRRTMMKKVMIIQLVIIEIAKLNCIGKRKA